MINKSSIVYYNDLLGIITIQDLLNYIEQNINELKKFENIIYDILKINKYDDEIIASLFNKSIVNNLKFIYDILNDSL